MKYIKEQGLTPLKITSKPKLAKAEQVVEQPKVVFEQTTAQPTISLGRPRSGYTDIPLTSMRAVIAKRLRESKSTSPHGYSTAGLNFFLIFYYFFRHIDFFLLQNVTLTA